MKSALSNVSKAEVLTDPFPHVVIHDVLDEDLYNQLAEEYPPHSIVTGEEVIPNNSRLLYDAPETIPDERISPLWREFSARQVTQEFYQEVIDLFGDVIREWFPVIEKTEGKRLEELKTYMLRGDSTGEVELNCNISWNSPVTQVSSVRGGHVDNPLELFAGLLYFPVEGDTAGGNLMIQRPKKPNFPFIGKAEVENRFLEEVRTVPYQRNTLVFFINSQLTLHAVTPRSITNVERRFFNIVGRLKYPLFDLPRGGLLYRGQRKIARLLSSDDRDYSGNKRVD